MIFCGIVLLLAIVLLRAYCLHNDAYGLTETQPCKKVLQNLEKNLSSTHYSKSSNSVVSLSLVSLNKV